MSEECNILRLNLSEAQNECDQAKQERTALQVKVGNLEETIKVSTYTHLVHVLLSLVK